MTTRDFDMPNPRPRREERSWMLREGQYDALTYLPKGWEAKAALMADMHGEGDPACKAFLRCAGELSDWLRMNGFPEPPR